MTNCNKDLIKYGYTSPKLYRFLTKSRKWVSLKTYFKINFSDNLMPESIMCILTAANYSDESFIFKSNCLTLIYDTETTANQCLMDKKDLQLSQKMTSYHGLSESLNLTESWPKRVQFEDLQKSRILGNDFVDIIDQDWTQFCNVQKQLNEYHVYDNGLAHEKCGENESSKFGDCSDDDYLECSNTDWLNFD